ncbi:peptidoglycan D,D-transpeptidase FtsI family protein [Bacillus kexueae]|uniref:peptidoglycan D,D-transpeptidase FtsI family protein n=1 Tax=Aeribacillus kexueae TaxID=2078952 RepID=UPI001FAFECD0|nr:penicillin-binding protein 2 [Bacillus kexueae]
MKRKERKKPLIKRLNILFLITFFVFIALILRLGIVQIVYGELYKEEVEKSEEIEVNSAAPRGKIFDRNLEVMVTNQAVHTVTYTKTTSSTQAVRLELAKKLAEILEVSDEKVTERDLKDYWILTRPSEAEGKVSAEERQKVFRGELTNEELYSIQLERISESDLSELTPLDREIVAIKREMDRAAVGAPQAIKKGATNEEIAYISEHLSEFPGVNVTTDWERQYPFGNTLRTMLGNVSTQEEGLPNDQLEYFLARDYNLNDRVGTSYIEKQFESVLQGERSKIKNLTDSEGNLIESVIISEGQAGNDLVLTVDMDLQLNVEEIIEEELLRVKRLPSTELLDRAFVVMMDPNTGELLAMAGKQIVQEEDGSYEVQDFALGAMTTSYTMGSAVKGATVLTGFETGVISPGTVLVDEPLHIKDSPVKSSWKTMGAIDDLEALKMSSNVYMFKTAIAIGEGEYRYNQALPLNVSAFSTMRYYFHQFGLGVPTGIDLPNESSGYEGKATTPGLLLDYAIGQYDTYTPLQLAQYVSTIANGGYRLKPQIIKEIRATDPNEEIGPIVSSMEPEILNRVDMNTDYIERVQEGFRQVFQERNGTAYTYFSSASYEAAGKTGTAQAFYDGPIEDKFLEPTYNLSIVGYAPYDSPEIAFAVVVPWAYQGASNDHGVNKTIARKVLDAYFNN